MKWPILAAIRFFLALVVAGSHLTWYMETQSSVSVISYFSGMAAVLGFLVMSGYSIAASYAKQRNGFYWRRVLRIIPLYVVLIAFSAVGPALLGGQITVPGGHFVTPQFGQVLGNLFFLQGFLVMPLNTCPVVWTLSVEVFFYLATPWLARLSQRTLLFTVLALAGLFACSRFLHLPFYAELLYGSNVVLLGWAWLLGFWIFRAREHEHTIVVALSLGICVMAFNNSFLTVLWPITWIITILAIGYAELFPYGKRLAAFLSLLGDASYPLYLAHMPVFLLLYGFRVSESGWVFILVAIVFSIVLDRCFDRPLKRLIATIAAKNALPNA
jgi:peptidoglycan/LPS O-acetylase OafA/YrhL